MMQNLKILALILVLFQAHKAYGFVSPIGLSVVPPVQLPKENFAVAGIRLDLIWGIQQNVYGIDVGTLVNSTLQNSVGIQAVGGMNLNRGNTTIIGLQVAGIANINIGKTYLFGIQAGLYNENKGESFGYGVQVGAINLCDHMKLVGLELGLYNKAFEVYGFQIGLINSVEDLHGIQIGLLNFNNRGLFAVAPILNIGF